MGIHFFVNLTVWCICLFLTRWSVRVLDKTYLLHSDFIQRERI